MRALKEFLTSRFGPSRHSSKRDPIGPLREFVYLDEVSVYSLLASRQGGVKTETIEKDSVMTERAGESSIGGNVLAAEARLSGQFRSEQLRGTQVIRKAIVQTSFKELFEIEQGSLELKPPDNDPPAYLLHASSLSSHMESGASKIWCQRGGSDKARSID